MPDVGEPLAEFVDPDECGEEQECCPQGAGDDYQDFEVGCGAGGVCVGLSAVAAAADASEGVPG